MLSKSRTKSLLYGYEIRALAIISNGLVHRTPKQKILKILKNDLQHTGKYMQLGSSEMLLLWNDSYSRYVRISRKTFSSLRKANKYEKNDIGYDDELKLRKEIVYETVRKEFKPLERIKNEVANRYELKRKDAALTELLSTGIFYLCSAHEKPAEDHREWEGKIYVSENWEERLDADDVNRAKIEAYIKNHDIKTVEWVTGEPVYLVTRPNCKHYFIEVSVEEVLGHSAKSLLKSHNLYIPYEEPMSYSYEQYKDYYERDKMLNYLKTMFDTDKLDQDIKDTRKLVRKWWVRAKSGRE